MKVSVRLSESYPFDPALSTSEYEGAASTVYAYLVVKSSSAHDPTVSRLDTDYRIETDGVRIHRQGFVTSQPWRDDDAPRPTSFHTVKRVDCARSRPIGYWKLELTEGLSSVATFTLRPDPAHADSAAGRWQPLALDASGSRIPVTLLAGAGLNT